MIKMSAKAGALLILHNNKSKDRVYEYILLLYFAKK